MANGSNRQDGGLKTKGLMLTSKGDAPLITVVTIVYNGEKHLEQTIKSVLNQSYENIEYIIIDGGSTDDSINIIKKYENSIYYWQSESDLGISDAFNKGIKLAQGSFIGLINADDWYNPDAILQISHHIHPTVDIIYGKLNYWENGSKINVKSGNHLSLLGGLRGMTMPHPATFIARSLYEEIGMYDVNYKNAMDYQFFLRASKHGAVYKKIDKVISNFRSGGVTSRHRRNAQIEVSRAKRTVLGFSKLKVAFQHAIYFIVISILGDYIHRLKLDKFK